MSYYHRLGFAYQKCLGLEVFWDLDFEGCAYTGDFLAMGCKSKQEIHLCSEYLHVYEFLRDRMEL